MTMRKSVESLRDFFTGGDCWQHCDEIYRERVERFWRILFFFFFYNQEPLKPPDVSRYR